MKNDNKPCQIERTRYLPSFLIKPVYSVVADCSVGKQQQAADRTFRERDKEPLKAPESARSWRRRALSVAHRHALLLDVHSLCVCRSEFFPRKLIRPLNTSANTIPALTFVV